MFTMIYQKKKVINVMIFFLRNMMVMID